MTQLFFLKDKPQLPNSINLLNQFSNMSGLKLNLSKCEILSLHKCNDAVICNIPVKETVKYLGVIVTKNLIARQHLNFSTE